MSVLHVIPISTLFCGYYLWLQNNELFIGCCNNIIYMVIGDWSCQYACYACYHRLTIRNTKIHPWVRLGNLVRIRPPGLVK